MDILAAHFQSLLLLDLQITILMRLLDLLNFLTRTRFMVVETIAS